MIVMIVGVRERSMWRDNMLLELAFTLADIAYGTVKHLFKGTRDRIPAEVDQKTDAGCMRVLRYNLGGWAIGATGLLGEEVYYQATKRRRRE
jgi:hypothetical protein